MGNKAGETLLERAGRLIQEGWSLRKHVVKGKVYARMRKGNEEVYLGSWIPEFDELLARTALKPEEKGRKERPNEVEKKAKLERGGLKPLFYVFWSGIGIGWLSVLLLALPFLVRPIPPELRYFLPDFVRCCFLLWLATRLILHGFSPSRGKILVYSGLAASVLLASTVFLWPRPPGDEPEFWFRIAYAGAVAWFGLWSILSGRELTRRETVSR
jgi:hypothetical protein